MAQQGEPQPDLAQVLATLASLSQAQGATQHDQQQIFGSAPSLPGISGAPLAPASYPAEQAPAPQEYDPTAIGRSSQNQPYPPRPQNKNLIDPATITEWKHGLRCVNKIAAQSPNFVVSVRQLMKQQERSVREWETGRKRLLDDHKFKRENERTQRAALSLPGLLDNTPLLRTPERETEELEQYDHKVYRASRQMVESQSAQLKSLGVPFFGLRPDLLRSDDARVASLVDEMEMGSSDEKKQKITKKELLGLQRRMLSHLGELYGD